MTRLAPFRDRESLEVGRGRYRIEERLGRGGAAAVYRGLEVGTHCKVAIKRCTEALDSVPAELDALVMSLISDIPIAGPGTTGEVIDLVSALLGIESDKRESSEVELEQPTLVARDRERTDLQRRLDQVRAGRGECTTYVGQRGASRAGRSRPRRCASRTSSRSSS